MEKCDGLCAGNIVLDFNKFMLDIHNDLIKRLLAHSEFDEERFVYLEMCERLSRIMIKYNQDHQKRVDKNSTIS